MHVMSMNFVAEDWEWTLYIARKTINQIVKIKWNNKEMYFISLFFPHIFSLSESGKEKTQYQCKMC